MTAERTKPAGGTLTQPVTGTAGIPTEGVGAVSLNVTVTGPTGPGYVTVYPCGVRPTASNLNHTAGQTIANAVLTPVSASGQVCFYTAASTHLIVDVTGWIPASSDVNGWFGLGDDFSALTPTRLLDTRATAAGYVTAYPCGTLPPTSTINHRAGQTIANAVLAPVSPTGTVCFYAAATTHLVVDTNGWFST